MTSRLRRKWTRILGLLQAVILGSLRGASARWKDLHEARQLLSRDGLRRFREFPELLAQLYREGGIRVVSDDPAGRPIASTLITLGGDVVSQASPEFLEEPALCQRHLQKLQQDLASLSQIPSLLSSLSSLLTVGLAGLGGYFALGLTPAMTGGLDAILIRAAELGQQLKWPAIAGGLTAGARYGLGLWFRAQFDSLQFRGTTCE